MFYRLRKILQATALVGLVLTSVVALCLWYINTLDFREPLESYLADSTGMDVRFEGPLRFTLRPLPTVVAKDVRIANPDWAQGPYLAKASRVEVSFDLFTLFSARPVIHYAYIRDAEFDLQKYGPSQVNWRSEDREPGDGEPPVSISRLVTRDVKVRYRDFPGHHDYSVHFGDGHGRLSANQPMSLESEGVFRETPFTATLDAGRFAELYGNRSGWSVSLGWHGAGATIKAVGRVDHPLTEQNVELSVSMTGDRLDRLRKVFDLWLPWVGPFEISYGLRGAWPTYTLSGLDARFGNSDLTGKLIVGFSGTRPDISGRLGAQMLDIDDLIGHDPDRPPRPEDGRLFDARRIPFHALANADARIKISADRFRTWPMEMFGVETQIGLSDGILALDPFRASMADGRLDLRFDVDATDRIARARVRGSLDDIRLEQLLPELGLEQPLHGRMGVTGDLAGNGNSLRELAAQAEGKADVVVGEGDLPIWGFDLIATDLVQAMMPWARHGDRTQMNCMVGRFKVHNGIARAEGLLIDTSRITVGGVGAINLRTERIEFLFHPKPKDPSLISLATPVRVRGTLKDHRAVPDAMGLATKGAAGLLLGAINPVAAIVPFLNAGTGVQNPCASAIGPNGAIAREDPRGPLEMALDVLTSVRRVLTEPFRR